LVKELIKWEKCQKNVIEGIAKRKPCMPFYHCPRSFVSKVVSTRSRAMGKEEVDKATIGGHEKKGDSKG